MGSVVNFDEDGGSLMVGAVFGTGGFGNYGIVGGETEELLRRWGE